MPIDARMVKWDDAEPAAPKIDPRMVKWEDVASDEPALSRKDAMRASLAAVPLIGPTLAALDANPRDIAKGFVSGFADVGNTLMGRASGTVVPSRPETAWMVNDANRGAEARNAERARTLEDYNRENDSSSFAGGRIAGNMAATAPVGGVAGQILKRAATLPAIGRAAPVLNALGEAAASGGMRTGLSPTTLSGSAGNMAVRMGGGALNGALTAGVIDPDSAGMGAAAGAALPLVTGTMGAGGRAVGRALAGGGVSDEVRQLAQRAQELGIKVPADRLVNSRPLNAVASSLNYLPLSGRAATEEAMQSQMNRALSRTFGQDSDNVTAALRRAKGDLGGQFDDVLRNNPVMMDDSFRAALKANAQRATQELPADQASVIHRQVENILSMVENGQIDGQAAYNIKQTLDRIGKQNAPTSVYAKDVRGSLMDALNRSLGDEQAQAFAQTRKQYGNMKALERLAQNGAEGDVSIARLANMKNIGNKDMQELADIAAQFLKAREGQHGAAQRIILGGLGAVGAAGGVPVLPMLGGMAAGRGVNGLLNSGLARSAVLGDGSSLLSASIPEIGLLARTTPGLLVDH